MKSTTRKRARRLLIFLLLFIMLGLFCCYENNAIETTRYQVVSDRLPQEYDGLVIAQISDLHNKLFGKGQEKLISKLRQEAPDLIVITGDSVDSNRPNVENALVFMREAAALAPVYFVTGNHDNWLSEENTKKLYEGLSDAGVVVLKDEVRFLAMTNETQETGAATQDGEIKTDDEKRDDGSSGDVICLMGIDDDTLASAQKLQDTLSELQQKIKEREGRQNTQPFTILLAHEPQLFDIYAEHDIDLVLCGHAHGGQFRLPFIGGFVAPDQGFLPVYTEGKHERESTTMIISRGLGNSVIPIRLLNRPELVTITLRSV